MKIRYLLLIGIVGFFGYQAYYQNDSPRPGIVESDHGKIRNRQEMIRYYERQIRILAGQSRARSSTVATSTISQSSSGGVSSTTSLSSDNITRHGRIVEYQRKIAEMRAEISALESGHR